MLYEVITGRLQKKAPGDNPGAYFVRHGAQAAERSVSLLLARLNQGDGGGGHDVVHRAAAGKVGNGLGEALEEGTEGLGVGQALHELIADITAPQVREHKGIYLAGNRAARGLFLGDRGNEGGVGLELAVESYNFV